MKCVRCNDTGLVEYTSGTFTSGHWERGELYTTEVEATLERPVYRRCGCAPVLTPMPPIHHYTEREYE